MEGETAWDISAAVLSMILLWFTLYNVVSVCFADKKPLWHCQIIALIHTTAVLNMVYKYQLKYDTWPLAKAGEPLTTDQTWIVIFSLSFFVFETGWYTNYSPDSGGSTMMILHHIFSIIALVMTIYLDESGTQVCSVLFMTEISTPILLLRYFARYDKWNKVVLFLIEIAFTVTFFIFRIVFGTYCGYYGLLETKIRVSFKAIGIGLYFVSAVFMLSSIKLLIRNGKKLFS